MQNKFYEWFGEPIFTTEPPLPLTDDLQKKFSEWFGDPIPDANPSLTTIVNPSIEYPVSVELPLSVTATHPIGNTVPANLPFPTPTDHSHSEKQRSLLGDLRKFIIAVRGNLLRAEIAYLSIGLFLGISTIGFLATGTPNSLGVGASLSTTTTPSALPTNTPIPTSTSVPILIEPTLALTIRNMAPAALIVPTPTPIPSDTLIGLLKIGYLSQSGPLSLTDQFRVYESALKHVGISTDEIQVVGEQVNGPGYGSPDNICGPLSLAILQEAGIVRSDIKPHAFWLLNPDVVEKRKLLAQVFPPDRFENIRFRIPLKNMDWQTNPLYPGDFIYIYAGTGGTFEHMLVVDRVDSAGRAYSINNYMTPDGFIISEVLLYNPADPNAGMFPTWTARPNSKSGSTGFAGFEVWRLRTP
ncbi:MAG: hypothetical protein QM730_24345 [Anaerolineales bacterium]